MQPADLEAIRLQLGLSKPAFARALGISRSQLANYLAGSWRGTGRPAPIPLTVELAARYLAQPTSGPKEN